MERYFQAALMTWCLCSCTVKKNLIVETPKPWENLQTACKIDHDKKIVICDQEAFWYAGRGCISAYEQLAICKTDLEKANKISNVNLAQCQGELWDCNQKLSSPWRSPWLWGGLGLLIGLSSGFVIGFTK